MQYYFYTLTADSAPDKIRYVGVTTRTLNQRMCGHKYNAIHDNKRNQPVHKWMWSVMQKGDTISIHFLDECDEALWEDREKYWIQYYKDQGHKLLNIQAGGRGVITKAMRNIDGIQRSINAHKKAVCQIDPKTLQLVATYDSVKSATEAMGLNSKSAIGNALSKVTKTTLSAGYYWVYKTEYESNTYQLNKINPYVRVKTSDVYRFNLNGELINVYKGVCSAVKDLGIKSRDTKSLHRAIDRKTVYYNSYWSWNDNINLEEYGRTYQYCEIDDQGTIIDKFNNLNDIAKKYHISKKTVKTYIQNNILFGKNKIIKIKI